MKKWMAVVLAVAAATAFVTADIADARRLGGGRSFGAQRQMTPPPAAAAPTPRAATPGTPQAAPTAPAAAAGAAAPARAGASRWLGPIAGIAAGLGLAALLSHFGLSEGFASMLLIALVVIGGVLLVRMLFQRRPSAPAQPAYAGIPPGRIEPRVEPTTGAAPARFEPVMGAMSSAAPMAAPAAGTFPAGFDPRPFVEQAKLQFRRMQTAYDNADRKSLAEVMTPEMFSEVSTELAGRGAHLPTEVRDLDAQVLEMTTEGDRHWMSVRFTGLLREDGTVLPKEFDEVWNLVKPVDDSSGWMLAGIQQTHAVA